MSELRQPVAQATEVAPVSCPCCNGVLYLARRQDEGPRASWIASAGTPEVKSDVHGAYVTCQHCFRRISVAVVRESVEGVSLEIPEGQECGTGFQPLGGRS